MRTPSLEPALWLQQARAAMRRWRVHARQRRELRALDARTAQDVGITLSQARFLADTRFWHGRPDRRL